ncbi:hypothetical protein M0R72_21410 [Candidatus Pacearchaeota archaeon]|jgi:hypothetical protein|nr:hypothetical protein [Candidatus Pacearchaeota archaeon]
MAWLAENIDYTLESSKTFPIRATVWNGTESVSQFVVETATSEHADGMTEAGALAQAAAYLVLHPTADVSVERQNEAGAYRVVINSETRSVWEVEE